VPVFNKDISPGGQITFGELKGKGLETDYNHYDHLFKLDNIFDHIIKFTRKKEERIWNILKFNKYYRSFVKEIISIFQYPKLKNIFIFSDKEKPIEIISSMAKEKYLANVFLIDEGIVSYYNNPNYYKSFSKWLIVKAFNYKYISSSMGYGQSRINDYFLTFDKKNVINQKNIIEFPPLILSKYAQIFNIKYPAFVNNTVIFISNALSEGNVISISAEKELIKEIIDTLKKMELNVVIKPHPVEITGKYDYFENEKNVHIIDDLLLPVECYFSDQNIKLVCGITSSALLNAKRNGMKVLSLIKLVNKVHPIIPIYEEYGILIPDDLLELKTKLIPYLSRLDSTNTQFNTNVINRNLTETIRTFL